MKRVNGVRARIGASPGNTFTHCCSKLNPRMLPNHKYPIPQREPLIRIIRKRERKAPTSGLSAGPGLRCHRLPLLALEFVRQPTNVI